eukprot:Sdes_comp23054_c0_seq1m21391
MLGLKSSLRHGLRNLVHRGTRVGVLGGFRRDLSGLNRFQGKPDLITTPIFYVNADPHLGHIYTTLLGDAYNRWLNFIHQESFYSTGTDEHGLKIQKTAELAGKTPQQLCDQISERFKQLFDVANIQYHRFIRTTDQSHGLMVQKFWERLVASGHLVLGDFEGWYCVNEEAFVPLSNVEKVYDENHAISASGQRLIYVKENNYLFDMRPFLGRVEAYVNGLSEFGVSTNEKNFLKQQIDYFQKNESAGKISLSRDSAKMKWGITVPGDEKHKIYVWFDALVNYLTVAGFSFESMTSESTNWPPKCHIIGKDILKFHCIYWPCFLMAVGLEPCPFVFCHGHWLVDGVKMSKSLGNGVDPMVEIKRLGVDPFRFYLLGDSFRHVDNSYSLNRVTSFLNSKLVNTIGNFVSRSVSKTLNPSQLVPLLDRFEQCSDEELFRIKDRFGLICDSVNLSYQQLAFSAGVDALMNVLYDLNKIFSDWKPWELARKSDASSSTRLDALLYVSYESIRLCALILGPIMPVKSTEILNLLNVSPQVCRVEGFYFGAMPGGQPLSVSSTSHLFSRFVEN